MQCSQSVGRTFSEHSLHPLYSLHPLPTQQVESRWCSLVNQLDNWAVFHPPARDNLKLLPHQSCPSSDYHIATLDGLLLLALSEWCLPSVGQQPHRVFRPLSSFTATVTFALLGSVPYQLRRTFKLKAAHGPVHDLCQRVPQTGRNRLCQTSGRHSSRNATSIIRSAKDPGCPVRGPHRRI